MNRRKRFLLFLMVIAITLTSGCWDKQELNEIALVSAIGLDKGKDGKLLGSYQIINPGNVAGALQGGGSGEKPPITVLSATGNNVLELDKTASSKSSRYMYLPHANLLVISEELAREEGIETFLDAFDRSTNFRSTARLVIARDVKAKDIVETLTSIDKVSADKVIKTLESTEENIGESISVNIQELIKSLVSPGQEPVIGGITIMNNGEKKRNMEVLSSTINLANPKTAGIAIIKKGKLVDWVDGEKAQGTLWVLNKMKTVNVNIDWNNKKDAISYQAVRQKTKRKVKMINGKPKVFIKVMSEGDLREATAPLNLNDTQVLMDIEKELSNKIKNQIKESIVIAQKNKADIFGFGDITHQNYPKEWREMKEKWNDEFFPAIEVDIQVETYIRRTGLRNKPFLSDFKKTTNK